MILGKWELPPYAMLAPMAGVSDRALRELAMRFGAVACVGEMVSCKGLMYGSENTKALLLTHPSEKVKAVQIFGEDRDVMRAACESEFLAPFDLIDVNMGCPVPKLYRNGEGSALLNDLKKAEGILSACVRSGKNITVKTRIGLHRGGPYVTAEFARMAEGAGVKAITVHGRVREDYYAGEPVYEEIAAAKGAIRTLGGKIVKVEDYTIPTSGVTHRAVVIEKVSPTPPRYPRAFAKIKKQPL